ncbi:MAG: helix-turn-helix domain-containing protein [Halobacteriales archaeon]|nr:helix-turn-helix domain-containing protein [Halobacteriales archaeon]
MTLLQAPALQAPGTQPTRERVLALVAERAWTPRELGDVLGVDRKTAEYHLHALRRRGLVAEREVHGERRFALVHGAPRAFADARPGRTRFRVARIVEQRGLVSLDDLAREAGASRNLTSYHVRRLAEEGIVRVRRVGNRAVVQAQGLAAQAEVTIGA